MPSIGKSIPTESRLVVALDWRWERSGRIGEWNKECSISYWDEYSKTDCGDDFTALQIYSKSESYTWNRWTVSYVNYISIKSQQNESTNQRTRGPQQEGRTQKLARRERLTE
jgi:hypothetical protein